jgi:hypothetical protein
MGARGSLKGAVAACLIVATAGCIHLPPSAVKVQEKDVRFLQQGMSTRDEVLYRLGQPNILDGKLVSVYEWWTEPGIGIGFFPGAGADFTGSNHSRLLVEFDEAGKARHFAFAEYRYPGLNSNEAPGSYFVDGSARELPRPAAPLLKRSRSLGGGDSQSMALLLSQNPYEALAISRDGRYVAAAPATGGIEVWDLSTGTNRTFASGLDTHGLVFSRMLAARIIDISRDGKILAAGFDDAAVLWDMASGARLHVIRGLGKSTIGAAGGPAALELAPNGRTVATGGHDGTVKLWDVASGKETSSFPIGGGMVQSLAFAPQGDLLAAGTSRGDVIVVDLADGKQARILHGSDALEFSYGRSPPAGEAVFGGRRVAFSPSGKTLAANDCIAVELWRVSEIREQTGPLAAAGRSAGADKQQEPATAFLLPYGRWPGCRRGERTYLAFSPDDEVLIASSNLYSVWDLRSRRLLAAWDPSRDAAQTADLTLSPGAALLAWSDSQGKGIQIIDLAPIIREAMEGGQRTGSQGAAR